MIEFIENYWTYIVAITTLIAYLFDKGRTIWLEKNKKKKSYNRLFTSVTKLYLSYIKHKRLYSENPPFNFPDELFIPMIRHIDSFDSDIEEFKSAVDKESEIIPEILTQTYSLFDTINRLRIIDKINSDDPNEQIQVTDVQKVKIKRAQFVALSDTFDDFFNEILTETRKNSTVKKEFVENLKYFQTVEYFEESQEDEIEMMKKYYESLHRQNAIPDDLYAILKREFGI